MRSFSIVWSAERTKLLASKAWLKWSLSIFVAAAGVSALMGSFIISADADEILAMNNGQNVVRSVYSSPLMLCYLIAFASGVSVYARERRQKSLPMIMLISPRRDLVVLSKLVLGLILGTWYGLVYVSGVLLAGGSVLLAHGQELIPTIGVARTLIVMVSLFSLWCVFGVGLGMFLDTTISLFTGFMLTLLLPSLTSMLFSGSSWGRKINALYPGVATNLSTEPAMVGLGTTWLPWWGSYGVVVLWVVLAALIGMRAVLRADIDVD